MPEVTETQLPGVGVRHEFVTAVGDRVSVLSFRTGRRELAVYDRDDPDACAAVLRLDGEDTHLLTDLLGGTHVSETVAAMQQVEGVTLDWIPLAPTSAQAGVSIGQGALRTRTGASVVAVIRTEETLPAPDPDVVLEAGDTVVAVGTPEGLRALRELLGG